MPETECPQTSAFPCPICHTATNLSPMQRTLRTNGLPQFLIERLQSHGRKWICPSCSARAGEVPFTYLTFGGISMPELVIAQYHEGSWNLDRTRADIRWSIEHNGQRQPAPEPAAAPSARAGRFIPDFPATMREDPHRIRLDRGQGNTIRWFARDRDGRVFEWMHEGQPIQLGHWEQIGTNADFNTLNQFLDGYVATTNFTCGCGAVLVRESPANVYRRGLSPQQVQEVESGVAGYYHCDVESRHPDNQRRGFLRFSDGQLMSYVAENWIPCISTPARADNVDPQEVLRLLCDKLLRDNRARGGTECPEDVFAREVVRFWDSPESHDSLVKIARELLTASGHGGIAQSL